ncbi:uncharacterized protein LOC123306326 [Coccinella septempunctata]|uniref:uncharacterized protein LOC123306326 n=1 Tax=Coccinella septempunctata TaxID=41139 RepID=UPI001D079840|nr:uncharacterized protein LOC123306326 [Coccinella septempunctata]
MQKAIKSRITKVVLPNRDIGHASSSSLNSLQVSENEIGFHWTSELVLLLIRLVKKYNDEFDQGLKKKVWMKIACEMTQVIGKAMSYEQVDSKWKGLKKTYKKIKDHNNQRGNSLKRWEFFHAMDSFLAKKPDIQPIAVASSTLEKVGKASGTESTNNLPSTSRKRKSDNMVQKRHDEKMAKMDKFLKLFQISVEHTIGKKLDNI